MSVTVGAATRAFRQAGPYGQYQRTPGGSVATGTATRAARLGTGSPQVAANAAQGLGPAWTPPPIPAGAYNPIREIELDAGKRGTSNTIEDLGTKESRGQANYLLGSEGIARERAEQAEEHQKAVDSLQRGFARLGVRQTEQARGAGVLRGGAVLQSAAKRAANQQLQQTGLDTAFQRQTGADDRQLGALTLSRQQEGEDDATGVSRAEREQSQFGIDTRTLEAREASDNGYRAPTGPAAVLYNKVNPANGEHFREYKDAKGRTIHEYHSGRKVTV